MRLRVPVAGAVVAYNHRLALAARGHLDARGEELGDGALVVAGMDVDGAGGVAVDDDVETKAARVERRVLDAVVERQAGDVNAPDPPFAKQGLEGGPLEARIALQVQVLAGIHNRIDTPTVERGVKLSARCPLDAMDRPRATLCLEGVVVRWVPIARGQHEVDRPSKAVDELDHLFAPGDREGATGTEVVLDVHDDQRLWYVFG
jgi:hypothetical protein